MNTKAFSQADFVDIVISGIVQGVGFRPFLFNFLSKYPIAGTIQNTGNLGVTLHLKRLNKNVQFEELFQKLKKEIPPIAFIEQIKLMEAVPHPNIDYSQLRIIPSNPGTGKGLTLPPDIAICTSCLKEFKNSLSNRFYEYPFIACAECGPRFTIMRSLPYDRQNSTVDIFPFCDSCNKIYNDPENRRFHAQTFNCTECGPFYYHYIPNTPILKISQHKIMDEIVEHIKNSKIIALKGIGGVNLICRADDQNAIASLRERKRDRKFKPFAVMFPDESTIHEYFNVSSSSLQALRSFRRPIVLLPKLSKSTQNHHLPENIAPGLPNIGVILPYMGIHYYIFEKIGNIPLIFTSGNVSSHPMATANEEIVQEIGILADEIYLHNREIYQRCDDSVIRPVMNHHLLIRRSRGYVPEYFKLPFPTKKGSILAVGAELNSTGAISRGDRIFPTQHIGNVNNLATFEFLDKALSHMQNLLQINPDEIHTIVHDLHPLFQSTKLAKIYHNKLNNSIISVQHHHAHLASLMVDHKLSINEEIVVIAADGIGYGIDGTAWGGEILLGGYLSVSRMAWINPIPMIGGDLCAKYPDRMLMSLILNVAAKRGELENLNTWESRFPFSHFLSHGTMEAKYIFQQIEQIHPTNKNKTQDFKKIPLTSSFGRCLDAIAAGFDVCHLRTYRGEPAMRLEGFIWDINGEDAKNFDFLQDLSKYTDGNKLNIDEMIYDAMLFVWSQKNKLHEADKRKIARYLVEMIARIFARKAIKIAVSKGINKIGFTGGIAYNEIITRILNEEILKAGLEFLMHRMVPPGDAGISIGQIAIAAAKYQKK